jgi:hypothetical protein
VELPPTARLGPSACTKCSGSGLVAVENQPEINTENYPHVDIIGGGIGGAALQWLVYRGIPFTFTNVMTALNHNYGTLQQASKTIKDLGLHL